MTNTYTDVKKISAQEFRDLGFLQEVNRRLLHPAGLALEVTLDPDTGESSFSGCWDYRDDPEGIVFGPNVQQPLLDRAKAASVDEELERHAAARRALFGDTIQPVVPFVAFCAICGQGFHPGDALCHHTDEETRAAEGVCAAPDCDGHHAAEITITSEGPAPATADLDDDLLEVEATLTDVVVYGTYNEAAEDGARRSGSIWVAADGSRVITPASTYPLDGLRVTSFRATPAAMRHHNWPKIEATLERSMLKTRRAEPRLDEDLLEVEARLRNALRDAGAEAPLQLSVKLAPLVAGWIETEHRARQQVALTAIADSLHAHAQLYYNRSVDEPLAPPLPLGAIADLLVDLEGRVRRLVTDAQEGRL